MRKILFRMSLVVTLSTLVFGIVGCAKSEVPQSSAGNQVATAPPTTAGSPSALSQNGPQNGEPAGTTAASTGKGKIDACALLTSPEIKSIQGEPSKETKASGSAEKGFSVSQCFFTLPTFNNSISLVVTQKGDGADGRDPKEFWEATFDRESEGEREKERDKKSAKERENEKARARSREEEEEEGPPAQKITGVGDEAFWTGSRVGGALYVLKGSTYLRISVGGAGDQQSKINKSKALARLALKRL
jgi:hypothetical protein